MSEISKADEIAVTSPPLGVPTEGSQTLPADHGLPSSLFLPVGPSPAASAAGTPRTGSLAGSIDLLGPSTYAGSPAPSLTGQVHLPGTQSFDASMRQNPSPSLTPHVSLWWGNVLLKLGGEEVVGDWVAVPRAH